MTTTAGRTAATRATKAVDAGPSRALSRPGDALEQEADRVAGAVVSGMALGRAPFSFASVPVVQRQDGATAGGEAAPKGEDEKYKDAAKKVGEAFLETAPGKEITKRVEELGEEFVATLPGKVITGAAITGAVAALAATHTELPAGIPEIPLDRLRPGLKLKVTYEGPVDKPTKVTATFTLPIGGGGAGEKKKPVLSESEKFRAETARLAAEQRKFREGLKIPAEKAEEQRLLDAWVRSRVLVPPAAPKPTSPLSFGAFGPTPTTKLTGEVEGPAPRSANEPEKKKPEGEVMRKAAARRDRDEPVHGLGPGRPGSGGHPLDPAVSARLQSRLGVDLSAVRVHTDSEAAESAARVDALAYTDGTHIAFGAGRYSPHTVEGVRLLAHELAHVVQQAGGSAAHDLGLSDDAQPSTLRRKESATTPEPDPVQSALKGDDNAVRDLTKHPKWLEIKLTAEQAATLIVHLLDGPTLDDDEQAGLEILWKEMVAKLLDDTLLALGRQGRFEQLLDDYHGSEYRDLLKLLSGNIGQKPVKELFLDAFIAMWWVRSHEEEAIVILLERTVPTDQVSLLTMKDRTRELRSAIDDEGYSKRFEIIVASVNRSQGGGLQEVLVGPQVSAILRVKATASVKAGTRTQAEADDLLRRAAVELTAELADYHARLSAAIKDPKADSGDIAKINKEFEKRLADLIEQKKAEFDLELEFNIEFNRALHKSFGKPWSAGNLRDFSRDVLSKIPPDILHANPDFEQFALAAEDPDRPTLGGQANRRRITLYDNLTLAIAAHEVGHTVQYDDNNLYEAFLKLSEWRLLTIADMEKEIPDEKTRKRLLEKLDADYAKAEKEKDFQGSTYEEGGYMYRFARYEDAGHYRRYKKGSCFIRDYAASAPDDDFADSFGYYLANPKALQDKCPEKYRFMHVRVFVEYRLSKQKERILTQFDDEARRGLLTGSAVASAVADILRARYLKPIRDELEQKLDAQRAAKVAEAEKSAGAKPVPIPRAAQGEALARPYLAKLRVLLSVAKRALTPVAAFDHALIAESIGADPALDDAFDAMRDRLAARYEPELLALVDPLAQRALKGEAVTVTAWPELDALAATYITAVTVVTPYLPLYRKSLGYRGAFASRAIPFFKDIKDAATKDRVRLHAIALRDSTVYPAFERWQNDVVERIRNGTPFNPSAVSDPDEIWKAFEVDMAAFAKAAQLQKSPTGAGGPGDSVAAQRGLDSPSQPLDEGTRAGMESYFGFDFSRVRIHAGPTGASSAAAVNARAFTAGEDVVFGQGQFSPGTAEGRGLLAHELAHVVQQGGAAPAGGAAEERAPEFELAFEEVDLPPSTGDDGDEGGGGEAELPPPPAAASPPPPPNEPAVSAPAAVAAAPLDRDHRPADDPSEREAARIEREVATLTNTAKAALSTTAAGVQGAPDKPEAKVPPGKELVFIMGKDTNKKNPFYSEAVKYFRATLPGATMVKDDKHRSLESVFDYLRENADPVGHLYLVSHANEDGTLSFPLQTGQKVRKTTYGDLRSALKDSPGLFSLPKGVIGKGTTIHIKGCNIGRSTRMLDALDEAFGGQGKVTAPTHKQVYGTEYKGKGKARKAEQYEALDVYFIEYRGNQQIPRADQVAEFQSKYTHLRSEWWEKTIPKKGATRQLVSTAYGHQFTITPKNAETKAMAVDDAKAKAVEWGEEHLSRPEIYEWRLPPGGAVPTAKGWKVTFAAEKTNYVVDKILVDASGKRLNPAETGATYFGTSVFGDEKAAAAAGGPGQGDTAGLLAELGAIDASLKEPTGADRDEKVARRAEVVAQLKERRAFVDVHVTKTEDWLGADEVYVRAGTYKSDSTKLNDGQSHSFDLPLASLFPLDQPATVEVYDEDLGTFFDRDDLIVKMVWQPPFADLRNAESLDEADYQVKAHV